MSIRILDLQLIYGVAGAREKFEDMVNALIHSEFSDGRSIQVKKGDGGIDFYVGPLTKPIDVYQAKFFPDGIGESQKSQIRESFRTCTTNPQFKVRSWTLCLPSNMTVAETAWFDEWKAKQSVNVETPWTASKLEALLFQDKNKGIKETYFKQEYLAQVRETHQTVQQIAANLGSHVNPTLSFVPRLGGLTFQGLVENEGRYYWSAQLHFIAENRGPTAIPKWTIKVEFARKEFDKHIGLTFQNPWTMPVNLNTILPTASVSLVIPFFIRIYQFAIPAVRQIVTAIDGLSVSLTPITENNVGDQVSYLLTDHFDLLYLQRAYDASAEGQFD